jgi:predicted transcriptional regulator of viral defense system
MSMIGGIEQRNRAVLDQLHRQFTRPFSIKEAVEITKSSLTATQKLLAHLASRGWLSRIRRGMYSTVPLGATSPTNWRADPWIVAATALSPCYLGGWTACHHWGLTEQLFRDVVVITERSMRCGTVEIQGTRFRVKSLLHSKHFGTRRVWRGQNYVELSDPSRTVVDVLDDPRIGGGIRHVAEVVANYFDSDHRDDTTLLKYIEKLGNRTVYKRLGYLAEILELPVTEFAEQCRERISSGLSLLDPSVRAPTQIVKRWNLRVNAVITPIAKS